MTATTSKVPQGPRFSNAWAAARVARRLIERYSAGIAGRIVTRHLERSRGSTHPQWAFRWVYWTTVLTEIERRSSYRFPAPQRAA